MVAALPIACMLMRVAVAVVVVIVRLSDRCLIQTTSPSTINIGVEGGRR